MFESWITLCVVLLAGSWAHAASTVREATARLDQGTIHGFSFKYPDKSGRSANIFLGIPYAKPPVGPLRFEKTEPVELMSSELEATKFAPACAGFIMPQLNGTAPTVSEDCLYLNVMTPSEKSPFPAGFPVIVWIHGGGFAGGSSAMYGFEALSHEFAGQGVIVVTVQYRLGAFGFFSTGDKEMPGNLGLWDQRQALLWVQQNIRAFGGNPNQVTLWGQNAGSASVGALSLSKHSRDLFHQAIEMSGSMFAGWATSDRVVDESQRVAKAVGCSTSRTASSLRECLKSKTTDELVEATKEKGWRRDGVNFARFQMRMDNDFFESDYETLLRDAPKKPTIQGINSQESMIQTLPFPGAPRASPLVIPPEKFSTFGRADLVKFIEEKVATEETFGEKVDEARKRLIFFYADRNMTEASAVDPYFYLTRYTQVLSDTQFAIPTLMEVRKKSEEGWPVYLYLWNYMNPRVKLPVMGTFQTYEFPYLFGISVVGPFEFDEADRKLQSMVVTSFANFAHSGNPSTTFGVWPFVTAEHPFGFFDMRPQNVLRDNLMLDRFEFWKSMAHDFDYDLIRDVDQRTEKPARLAAEA